jgi:hypothetical protein
LWLDGQAADLTLAARQMQSTPCLGQLDGTNAPYLGRLHHVGGADAGLDAELSGDFRCLVAQLRLGYQAMHDGGGPGASERAQNAIANALGGAYSREAEHSARMALASARCAGSASERSSIIHI